ncbi:V-type ATPase subunit [Anaeromyxobacter sp. Fw109-5]|uniref:V0D/AC39 family V-type ATPase subunit n=1 Tax=Anaeromyxobacter sp. (strain Fw109-5) TaxID=404589 RepID=UPI000158A57A|nr:V-type ATPase subunit [Anaeromyxobacter sp. Fw109-5]ABS26767.1 H+transporting two-sector ATPase C (AC39) subunit [Anaeromyxobacter sp. Fw109-5]
MARLDFANARLGARRARLLDDAALRALLARGGEAERLEALRASALGAAVPAGRTGGPDALLRVEAALREALRQEGMRLLEETEGGRARALLEAFLALDEAAAVAAIARGVAAGAPVDRTLAAAPPVPGLPADALRAAASARDVPAALAALAAAGSAVGAAAGAFAGGFRAERGLLPLEIAAERAALARARRACRRGGEDAAILARHLADRVDSRNAATLLALAGAVPAADALLEGGRSLAGETLRRVAALRHGDAVRDAVSAALGMSAAELATPWGAERALERRLVLALRREARARPLSLAVPLAHLAARRAEVRRVALVLRGAALGLPAEEILSLAEEGA